jgi:predicted RNA-binding protein with PIN domain
MYLIDGHNLIGTGMLGFTLDDPDDEMKLTLLLKQFAARTGDRMTVVFDHGLPGGVSAASNRSVEVIFASQPNIADKVMIGKIRVTKDPTRWTVVSNDAAVREEALGHRMKHLRTTDFARMLKDPEGGLRVNPAKPRVRRIDPEDYGASHHPYVPRKDIEHWENEFAKTPRPQRAPIPLPKITPEPEAPAEHKPAAAKPAKAEDALPHPGDVAGWLSVFRDPVEEKRRAAAAERAAREAARAQAKGQGPANEASPGSAPEAPARPAPKQQPAVDRRGTQANPTVPQDELDYFLRLFTEDEKKGRKK